MTAEELKALDQRRKDREDELILLLLLLLGWGVTQSLADTDGATEVPVGGNRPTEASLTRLAGILRTQGVEEIAGSMADAHLDAFAIFGSGDAGPEPDLNAIGRSVRRADSELDVPSIFKSRPLVLPDRDELARDYTPAAAEMADAMVDAIRQAKGDTLAESLLLAKYSRSDSTGLELGAERQIVTASNAGLIGGAIVRRDGPRLEGFRHVSVIDDRTTKICTERDTLQLPARDPYWEFNWPSLHWHCRSVIAPIFVPFKASDWRPRTPPDMGFGRMPAAVRRMIRRAAA